MSTRKAIFEVVRRGKLTVKTVSEVKAGGEVSVLWRGESNCLTLGIDGDPVRTIMHAQVYVFWALLSPEDQLIVHVFARMHNSSAAYFVQLCTCGKWHAQLTGVGYLEPTSLCEKCLGTGGEEASD